jgi:peroxiredoxin
MKKYFIASVFLAMAIVAHAGLNVGDEAKDFTLVNVDKSKVTLSEYASDKGVVVVFTCNHCPYAIAYEDRLIELHNQYAERGYPFIFVNPNDEEIVPGDSFEGMVERANSKNIPFPYVKDETQEIYKIYGATNTPHVYVLSKEKDKLVVSYIGAIDDNYKEPENVDKTYLADALDALLANKTPDPDKTKAIGCSIKDKNK